MIHRTCLLLWLVGALMVSRTAFAQDDEEDFTIEETEGDDKKDEPDKVEDPDIEIDLGEAEGDDKDKGKKDEEIKLQETRVSWSDIVVVMRKPFLKMNRLELVPQLGITINDNMIRHYAFQGTVNYFLTDILAVGLEGQLFTSELLETWDLIGRQHRRLPTLNKYDCVGSLRSRSRVPAV